MRVKNPELEIDKDDPFKHCKLKREQYADILTNIVNSYDEGFVLALDNKWGAGKTTFIKMWEQKLKNEEFETLYFNAWENDFGNDPMIAVLSELKTLFKGAKEQEEKVKSVIKKGLRVIKSATPVLLNGIVEKYTGVKNLGDAIEKVSEESLKILQEEVDEYANKKQSLIEFKTELEQLILAKQKSKTAESEKEESSELDYKPIIFIIDELDRCRPNYAVEVLEIIKHFFSVPGIVFVLSIDKVQLGHAIRGVYGSENIDADNYLKRFIDLSFSLPDPDIHAYVNYLYDIYSFDDFIGLSERTSTPVFSNDKDRLRTVTSLLYSKEGIDLRSLEKIFSRIRITINSFESGNYLLPEVLLLFSYLELKHPKLLENVRRRVLTIKQLILELDNVFKTLLSNLNNRPIHFLVSQFILLYSNNFSSPALHQDYGLITNVGQEGKSRLTFVSKVLNNDELLKILESYNHNDTYEYVKLDYFLNRYDLTIDLVNNNENKESY